MNELFDLLVFVDSIITILVIITFISVVCLGSFLSKILGPVLSTGCGLIPLKLEPIRVELITRGIVLLGTITALIVGRPSVGSFVELFIPFGNYDFILLFVMLNLLIMLVIRICCDEEELETDRIRPIARFFIELATLICVNMITVSFAEPISELTDKFVNSFELHGIVYLLYYLIVISVLLYQIIVNLFLSDSLIIITTLVLGADITALDLGGVRHYVAALLLLLAGFACSQLRRKLVESKVLGEILGSDFLSGLFGFVEFILLSVMCYCIMK